MTLCGEKIKANAMANTQKLYPMQGEMSIAIFTAGR
jgi:hypothetical protein